MTKQNFFKSEDPLEPAEPPKNEGGKAESLETFAQEDAMWRIKDAEEDAADFTRDFVREQQERDFEKRRGKRP
jgi:hypothetical protein